MTTTPLPPLAKSTPEQDDLFDHLYEYGVSAEGVHSRLEKVCQAYATQARADLEAENQRLREALREIADDYADRFDLESPSTNPGIKYVIEQARAALKGSNHD